jgi:hypothetical protein
MAMPGLTDQNLLMGMAGACRQKFATVAECRQAHVSARKNRSIVGGLG